MIARNLEQDFEALRAEVDWLRGELATATRSLAKRAGDGTAAAAGALQDTAEETGERLSQVADQARKRLRKSSVAVQHEIQEWPLTAVAATLATGLAVGLLLGWQLSR